jgi:hypothetical protein
MAWFVASDWEIVLSVATPLAVATLLFVLETRGPWAQALQRPSKLVGPYFTGVAILFGLFSAQLMNDAWQKENSARQSVQAEADALRALIQLARVNDQTALLPLIKTYASAAANDHRYWQASHDGHVATDKAYEALLSSLVHAYGLDGSTRTTLLATAGELRRARDRRLYLADDETSAMKWLTTLILGALTQLAIMLVHTGNRSAVRVSVGLFTVAFTFCLVIVAIFDSPFDTVMRNEPAATLNTVIKGL